MRRRDVAAALGALAAAPRLAAAQFRDRQPLVGCVISGLAGEAVLGPFRSALAAAGWTVGKNLRLDTRFGSDPTAIERGTREIVALSPDVIYASGTPAMEAAYRDSASVPLVFTLVADPIGEGWVASFAHPGGRVTGFVAAEGPVGGKYLQLLHEIAPAVGTVGLLFNPKTMPYAPPFISAARKAAAPGVTVVVREVSSEPEIGQVLSDLAKDGRGAVAVMPDTFVSNYSGEIVSEATRLRLPAIYGVFNGPALVAKGGLISYSFEPEEQFRRAGTYVARILDGQRPADLPVQAPTQYKLAINLKTAKALGLTIPPALLAIADQVIE